MSYNNKSVKQIAKIYIMVAILIVPVAGVSFAAQATGANFLKIAPGARAAGMGESGVALADDVYVTFWNPAGLVQVKNRELGYSHSEYYQGIRHEYISYLTPGLGGVLGMSGTYLSVGGIEGRTFATASPDRIISVWDSAAGLSYGFKYNKAVSAGATIRGIYQTLDDKNAYGACVDIGLLWRVSKTLKAGLKVENVGSETAFIDQQSPLPSAARAGVSKILLKKQLIVNADSIIGFNDETWGINLGCEYNFHNVFFVRLGYKYNSSLGSADMNMGGSVGFGLKYKKYNFDYAFIPYGSLEEIQKISFSGKF